MSYGAGFDPTKVHDANSVAAINNARGKVLEVARMVGDELHLVFADGTAIRFTDEAQSCCETRWMTCGDDLPSFTGDKFIGAELLTASERPLPEVASEQVDDVEDIEFLHVRFASGNVIVCETHNAHNGFYGGFDVTVREVTQ